MVLQTWSLAECSIVLLAYFLKVAFFQIPCNAQTISQVLTQSWMAIGSDGPELPGVISPFASSFEIQAHLIAGQTQRALNLMRLSWGWYLNHPKGTGSTTIEGYNPNGDFRYVYGNDGFDSHAHGWSSGPTSALTTYVLGLSVTTPMGATWRFAPQMGDLARVEGGFVTSLGKFQASWVMTGNGTYNSTINTPPGTHGDAILPVFGKGIVPNIKINGENRSWSWYRNNGMIVDSVLVKVDGGKHMIEVR